MMYKRLLMCILALAVMWPAQAFEWHAKVDTIWPARHYRELNGDWQGDRMSKTWIDWSYPEGTIVVYGLHFPTGHARADALFQCKQGQRVTFNVRIVHPQTGTVVLESSATSTKTSTGEQRLEIMPDTEIPFDGWYRFELTCPDGQNTLSRLNLLLFQRESTLNITDSEIFMAPSVHLWWASTVPGAPSGQAYDWTYLEVMYPSAYRHVATYLMSIGTDVGYSGIQMPTRADGSYGNSVLFSVWDEGDVEQDRNLPEHMRSAAVDIGPGTYATRFGGEGTGSSIRYYADTLWQFDHWIQFLFNERPERTQITTTDSKGRQKVIDYESTLQSMWYKNAEDKEWRYIGTLRRANDYRMTSGIYSFLENYGNGGGEFLHRCYFRNGAMRSAASGKWYALNKAGYGNTQNNGKRESRYDFGHGVTGLFENTFYLETGGYMGTRDSADSYRAPEQGKMPWVDTIDIDRLQARIDLAVTHNRAKSVRSDIEAARVVSDPATWKLTAYSDEETVGEGDNGRATFILDGDLTTYYHNKWKNGSAAYPHTFTFDAGQPVTVSSIEFYQSRDNGYRARQLTVFVSEDGKQFQAATSRLEVEDSDHPTVQLDSAITSRYFRLRFNTGYGSNLVINELYFKHDYRLEDLLALTQKTIDESDHFDGYAPADLQRLIAVYDEGRCTDIEALRTALEEVADNALPLTYGLVQKTEHLTSFNAYQLHTVNGRGDLVATEDGQLTVVGATDESALEAYRQPTSVTSLYNNWLVLRSETFEEYYLYNLGARKFLSISKTEGPELSEVPVAFSLAASGKGYTLTAAKNVVVVDAAKETAVSRSTTTSKAAVFELRNNYALTPPNEEVLSLLHTTEQQLHPEAAFAGLLQQAATTYSKAFVTSMDADTKLIRSSSALSSNVNSTQQEAHNLAKLVDGKTSTYWESWYSGISWPSSPGYVQARLTTSVPAFYLTFTPSQSPQYGKSDIPAEVRIYTSTSTTGFSLVGEINEGLPTEIDQVYTSPVIFSGQDIRYVRMEVLSTLENRDGGRVFAMSEMQIHPAVIDEEASLYCQRPWVKEAVDALSLEVQLMHDVIQAKTVTSEDADRLQAAIDRAEASYLDPTGISEVRRPEVASGETGHSSSLRRPFLDLTGRPVAAPRSPGIYLRDRKKVVVR